MRSSDTKRCPKCGRTFPRTAEFWYFHKTGVRRGNVTGYCKAGGCQSAACRWRDSEGNLTAFGLARRRLAQRDAMRRLHATDPARYRRSKYEAAS